MIQHQLMIELYGVSYDELSTADAFEYDDLPWASQYEKQLASKDRRQGIERDTSRTNYGAGIDS